MKTKFAIVTLCLLLAGLVSEAKEKKGMFISGQSLTELGAYTITKSEQSIKLGDEVLDTYKLVYSDWDKPVYIGVKTVKKCKNFIVRTEGFEIEYICKKHVFGVKKVDEKYRKVKITEVNNKMDAYQYYTQRVICQDPKQEEELLGLIACYFPALLKEEFRA